MKSLIESFLPIIKIEKNTLSINDLVRQEFGDIIYKNLLAQIDSSRNFDFLSVRDEFYLVNIIKSDDETTLFYVFNKLNKNKKIETTDKNFYNKATFCNYLDKFSKINQRNNSIKMKVLYFKLCFNRLNHIDKKITDMILNFSAEYIRNSDIIGKIDDSSFAVLLVNTPDNGIEVVINKIYDYIYRVNSNDQTNLWTLKGIIIKEDKLLKEKISDVLEFAHENCEVVYKNKKLKEY